MKRKFYYTRINISHDEEEISIIPPFQIFETSKTKELERASMD